jgi:twitching motility protein PilT
MPMLTTIMQSGRNLGMQMLDDVLLDLVQRQVITAKDAYVKANEKSKFEALAREG